MIYCFIYFFTISYKNLSFNRIFKMTIFSPHASSLSEIHFLNIPIIELSYPSLCLSVTSHIKPSDSDAQERGKYGKKEQELPLFKIDRGISKNIPLIREHGGEVTADGIHIFGTEMVLDRIYVNNIREDAIFKRTTDEIIQVNTSAEIDIDNIKNSNNQNRSKFLKVTNNRIYLGAKFGINHSYIDNPENVIGIDESGRNYIVI